MKGLSRRIRWALKAVTPLHLFDFGERAWLYSSPDLDRRALGALIAGAQARLHLRYPDTCVDVVPEGT